MIFGVRHGERADQIPLKHPERKAIEIKFDPQLTLKGVKQAQQTGLFLQTKIDEYAKKVGTPSDEMQAIVISSPFLRTIQSAYAIASGLRQVYQKTIYLQEEICEYLSKKSYDSYPMDGLFCKTNQHKIGNYIDKTAFELKWNLIKPEFRPKYPENEEKAFERTNQGMKLIKDKYFEEFDTKKFVLIYVTHRDTLQMSVSSFGKDYTKENCQYCSILQIFFEGNQQSLRNNPIILMEATSDHIKDLL